MSDSDGSSYVDYKVRWEQLDPNLHLRAAVLVEFAVNTQFAWMEHLVFKQARFASSGYEPIVLRMEARYHHEATSELGQFEWLVNKILP